MRGNVLGIIGMVVALAIVIVATTIEGFQFPAYTVGLIIVAMLIGAAIGVWKARRVQMTAMPELVALLHSFVGAAAVLVGINSFLMTPGDGSYDGAFHMGEVGIAVFIGAVTFTGSIIANLKLSARISGKPLTLPGRNLLNLIMVIVCVVCIGWFVATEGIAAGTLPLVILTIISLILGAHLVLAIGCLLYTSCSRSPMRMPMRIATKIRAWNARSVASVAWKYIATRPRSGLSLCRSIAWWQRAAQVLRRSSSISSYFRSVLLMVSSV